MINEPSIKLLIDLKHIKPISIPNKESDEYHQIIRKYNQYTVSALSTREQENDLGKWGIDYDSMVTKAIGNDINIYLFKMISKQIMYHCGKPRVYKTGLFSGPEKYDEFNRYIHESEDYLSTYDWILISHHSLSKLIDENDKFNFHTIPIKPNSDETINGVLEEKGYLEINEKQLKVFVTAYYPSNHNETEKIDMILGKGNWAEGEYFIEEHPKSTELNNTKYSMSVYSKEMFPSKRGYMRIVIEK